MDKGITKRLQLLKAQKDLSINDLAKMANVSDAVMKNYMAGRSKIPIPKLEMLSERLNVPLLWLINGTDGTHLGKDHRLQSQTTQHHTSDVESNRQEHIDHSGLNQLVGKGETNAAMIPFYSPDNSMTSIALFGEQASEPTGHIQVPGFFNCIAITLYGNDMSPKYDPGEIIFCKPIKNKRAIIFGHYYYIILEEYNLVRQLLKSDDRDSVVLASPNQGTQEISLDDIVRLYHIEGNIKRSSV